MDRSRGLLIAVCALLVCGAAAGHARQSAAVAGEQYRVEARAETGEIGSRFTPSQIAVLEKLNRADALRLDRLPLLVVPEVWLDDERAYSPLPLTYAAAAPHPKMLVVHLPGQAFGAYEWGELVRWGPVNSGTRETPTPPGLYALTWRSTGHASSVNPDWYMRWYFNFESREGLAFHEYVLPGGAASHGCVRLLDRDARWLYDWGDGWTLDPATGRLVAPGTPVLVIGPYQYDAPPLWRSPEWLRQPITLP
jgi:lipoprotein-anchoring transpeptidase ErfK/SrfK